MYLASNPASRSATAVRPPTWNPYTQNTRPPDPISTARRPVQKPGTTEYGCEPIAHVSASRNKVERRRRRRKRTGREGTDGQRIRTVPTAHAWRATLTGFGRGTVLEGMIPGVLFTPADRLRQRPPVCNSMRRGRRLAGKDAGAIYLCRSAASSAARAPALSPRASRACAMRRQFSARSPMSPPAQELERAAVLSACA